MAVPQEAEEVLLVVLTVVDSEEETPVVEVPVLTGNPK